MQSAKDAVSGFISRGGREQTDVDETINPAVTSETIKPHRHEEVTQAVDKEIHQDHYHTTVQPVAHTETLPEQHTHNMMPVQERTIQRGADDHTKQAVEVELGGFKDTSMTHQTKETQSQGAGVTGEHVHHHVHETVQPLIHKETIQPSVVHTTIPIHETHHAPAEHHGISTLPARTLDDFKNVGGSLTGSSAQRQEYEGHPKPYNAELQQVRMPVDKNPREHDGTHDVEKTGHNLGSSDDYKYNPSGGSGTTAAGYSTTGTGAGTGTTTTDRGYTSGPGHEHGTDSHAGHDHSHGGAAGGAAAGAAAVAASAKAAHHDRPDSGIADTTGTGMTGHGTSGGLGGTSDYGNESSLRDTTGTDTSSGLGGRSGYGNESSMRDTTGTGTSTGLGGTSGYGNESSMRDTTGTGTSTGIGGTSGYGNDSSMRDTTGQGTGTSTGLGDSADYRHGSNIGDTTSRGFDHSGSTTGGTTGRAVDQAESAATRGTHDTGIGGGRSEATEYGSSNLPGEKREPSNLVSQDTSSSGQRDPHEIQSPGQGLDPALKGEAKPHSTKLTGDGVPGSHSAVFGLTPDGKKVDDTQSQSTSVRPAHSKETSINPTSGRTEGDDPTTSRGPGYVADKMNPKIDADHDGQRGVGS